MSERVGAPAGWGRCRCECLAARGRYRAARGRPLGGRANYEFAQAERFILREDRSFLTLASAPARGG